MKEQYRYFFFILLFLNASLFGKVKTAKTVVIIGEVVKEFDEQTPCDFQYWASKLENSCKCCLIKKAPEILAQTKTAQEAIDECIAQEKHCNLAIIETLLKQERIADPSRQEALKKLIILLYNHSTVVKEAQSNNITFDAQGNFIESAIPNFLAQAFKDGVLSNPDFKNASCISAQDIISEKGFQTRQLFMVSSTCSGKKSEYVLKEIASGTAEILRLTQSVLIPELTPYVYPNHVSGYPLFIMPTAYISYRYNNKDHYLALMPKSEGIKISSLVELYKRKQISKEKIEKIFYEIGHALAKFHNKFMDEYKNKAKPGTVLTPTIVHGDAHQANIFYDEKTNTVILIDNERIITYLPTTPAWELRYLFFTTFELFTPTTIKKDQPFFNDWIYLTMKSFMKGYMSIYPKHQWKQIINEVLTDLQENKQRYEKYEEPMNRVFNELKKEAEIKPQVKPVFSYYPQAHSPLWARRFA